MADHAPFLANSIHLALGKKSRSQAKQVQQLVLTQVFRLFRTLTSSLYLTAVKQAV